MNSFSKTQKSRKMAIFGHFWVSSSSKGFRGGAPGASEPETVSITEIEFFITVPINVASTKNSPRATDVLRVFVEKEVPEESLQPPF